jgi:ribosome-binding factor A
MSTRTQRVEELLQREISEILQQEMRDPRLGFVTITGARVSPDLRQATIFYSVLGSPQEIADTGKVLQRAQSFVRGHVGRRIDMRVTPEIRFKYDDGISRGARTMELLSEVRKEWSNDGDAPGAGREGDPQGGSDRPGDAPQP